MEDLVGDFKLIASDKYGRRSLLADATSLGGLVLLLSKENLSVTLEVLQVRCFSNDVKIFSALITCEDGPLNLSKVTGLKESLVMLKNDENLSKEIRDLASEVYDGISFKRPILNRVKTLRPRPKRQSHLVVIQLTGCLLLDDLKAIEEQLLTIKGVISITFQLYKLRVVVLAFNTVPREVILDRVRSVCEKLATEKSRFDISAYCLRSEKSALSRQGVKRTGTVRLDSASATELRRASLLKPSQGSELASKSAQGRTISPPPPLKPYLSEDADIFEVDEKRGAPLPRGAAIGEAGQRGGIGSWLSDLFEKTLFW